MPPTLLLIRHAQALHNVADDWSILDPPLSELGEKQCVELAESLKKETIANEVELVVVSPMRRTLQTALLGLGWLIDAEEKGGKGVKVELDAGWQENCDKPCDTGLPIPALQSEFPTLSNEISTIDPLYPDKTTNLDANPYAFTRKAILQRGQTCLKKLYSRPEKVIAVVSHSGFLRAAVCNRRFFNADWRVFEYDEERMSKEGGFALKEWAMTEERGGGMGRSEKGVFGPLDADFPPAEVDKVPEEEAVEVPGGEKV